MSQPTVNKVISERNVKLSGIKVLETASYRTFNNLLLCYEDGTELHYDPPNDAVYTTLMLLFKRDKKPTSSVLFL